MIHFNKPHAPFCPTLCMAFGDTCTCWSAFEARSWGGKGVIQDQKASSSQVASPALQGEQELSQLGAVLCTPFLWGKGNVQPRGAAQQPLPCMRCCGVVGIVSMEIELWMLMWKQEDLLGHPEPHSFTGRRGSPDWMQLGHEMALHMQPMLHAGKHALESPVLLCLCYPFNLCTVALLALISRCGSWGRPAAPLPSLATQAGGGCRGVQDPRSDQGQICAQGRSKMSTTACTMAWPCWNVDDN